MPKIENSLLRAGLALAGPNRKDDSGILTALEASGLKFVGLQAGRTLGVRYGAGASLDQFHSDR